MTRRERIRAFIHSKSHLEHRGYKIDGVPSPCRIWDGPKSGKPEKGKTGRGYARMNWENGTVAVHRFNYQNEHGPLGPRRQLNHLCKQRDCIDDTHTENSTHKQNCKHRDETRGMEGYTMVGEFAGTDYRGPNCGLGSSPNNFGMPDVVIPRDGQMMIVDFKTREDPPWGSYNENVPAPDGFDPTNPADSTYRPPVLRPGTERTYIPGHGLIDAHIAKAPEEPADG